MNKPVRQLDAKFKEMLAEHPEFEGLAEVLESTAPELSVRLHPGEDPLIGETEGAERVPWWPGGIYLPERPSFTLDPELHQGCYYVQDASSMFAAYALKHLSALLGDTPVRLLDACAAPGGKTTAAIDAIPPGSLVVANEYVPLRANILVENLTKWGYEGIVVTRGDTRRLSRLREAFDIVLVDAPCSGEGMMRKEERAVEQWSPALVEECAERQREIVDNLWPTVRPGGYIVYSTCTFNRSEDEMMVDYLVDTLGAEPVALPVEAEWGIAPGIDTPYTCYRFLPGKVRGEGLFMAVVRKPGEPKAPKPEKSRAKKAAPTYTTRLSGSLVELTNPDGSLSAFPEVHLPLLRKLQKEADVIHYGITLGTPAGRTLAPTQSLAMARALRPDAYPTVEVSRDEALAYLRCECLTLPADTPRGYVLLTYRSRPLGFVKNIGNRANNLYPSHWRIRH